MYSVVEWLLARCVCGCSRRCWVVVAVVARVSLLRVLSCGGVVLCSCVGCAYWCFRACGVFVCGSVYACASTSVVVVCMCRGVCVGVRLCDCMYVYVNIDIDTKRYLDIDILRYKYRYLSIYISTLGEPSE